MIETIVWKDVLSGNVSQIGYDDENKTLFVKWSGGKISEYGPGVPADLADEVSKSWSVKTALTESIIGKFPMRYS